MHISTPQLIVYGITTLLILVVIGFRLRRMTSATPYNANQALIYPAVLAAFLAFLAFTLGVQGIEWAWFAGALVLGAVLGWFRAATVRMTFDPATRMVMAQGSAVAILFLILLFVLRTGLRILVASQATALGIRLQVTDVLFLALAVGLLGARALEMNLRARKLMAEAPAASIIDAP